MRRLELTPAFRRQMLALAVLAGLLVGGLLPSIYSRGLTEELNQEAVPKDVRNVLCGYVTFEGSTESHPEIFKHWNLMDVKIFRDVFTRRINLVGDKIDISNIQDILKNTTNDFNNKEITKELLKPSGDYPVCN